MSGPFTTLVIAAPGCRCAGRAPHGNLTTSVSPAGGTQVYGYDAENRLIAGPSGVTLRYDPLGRLFEIAQGGTVASRFVYDGDALVLEYDGAGNRLQRHVHLDGADTPVLSYHAGETAPRQLMPDHLGSIVSMTRHGGNRIVVNSYDEYGYPGAGNTGRFQYTGQAWLAELGLYHYKARMYSPGMGRFLQTDPIGYGDGLDWYDYVGGDPVNRSDPDGNCAKMAFVETGDHVELTFIELYKGDCVRVDGGGSTIPYFSPPNDGGQAGPSWPSGGGGGNSSQEKGLLDRARDVYCSLPSFGGSFSVREYDVLGGGLASDIAFDPMSGRLSFTAGVDVGVGFGGSANWSYGNSATVGRNIPDGWSGSVGLNANARLGPIAAGASTTFIGPSGIGFRSSGYSAGMRPRGSGATINGNLGVRGGYGGKILPSCGGDRF